MTPATVSVIIPVYDGREAFGRCLADVLASRPPPHEIVVASDDSPDGSAEHAERCGVRVVRLPRRSGPARARNAAAAAARGSVLLFIDADVVVPEDLVGRVAAAMSEEGAPAALFGSYDDAPSAKGLVSEYRNLLHHFTHQHGREEASTFWAGCGAIRADVFRSAGGFDERFREPSIEDIELGCRLRRDGHRVRLVPSLQVKHLKRWHPLQVLHTDVFRRAMPWTRLILANREAPNDLNLAASGRLSVLLAVAMPAFAAAAAVKPDAWAGAGAAAAALLLLNAPFYAFLARRRGPLFALGAVPWHWLYFLCSAVGFALGVIAHLVARGVRARA